MHHILGKWVILFSLFFMLWSSGLIVAGCGSPADDALDRLNNLLDEDTDVDYSEDIRKILAEVPSNEQRIETIEQGEGPSFEESGFDRQEVQTWLEEIIAEILKGPQKMQYPFVDDNRAVPSCEQDKTGSHGYKKGFMCGRTEAKSASLTKTKDGFDEFFRADVTYQSYADYSEQSLLNETGLYLIKKACNLFFCYQVISDLITTLKVSSQKDQNNNFKGACARLALHLTEATVNKDLSEGTSTYQGQALVESGNQRYSCSISGEDEVIAQCRVE